MNKRWTGTLADSDSDHDAGFVIDDKKFVPFSQMDDVFSRSFWDDRIRTDKSDTFYSTYRRPLAVWRKARGFRRRDYALRNAAWHVADVFAEMGEETDRRDGFLDPLSQLREASTERDDVGSPGEATQDLKKVATTLGADLVGVTGFDPRWQYTERFSQGTGKPKSNDIGTNLPSVIVIGQAMDPELIATAPSALAGAATGLGYSFDAVVLLTIAQYIRNLGYRAVPSMNDTALAIPYAVKAGLGEYARNGLVITPEYGSSLRFGKIFTDLPLEHDVPRRFGVKEVCEICHRCSDACPSNAIPAGEPSDQKLNQSTIAGVTKWTVDGEKCFNYWTKINSDCAVCIRSCPYTRDYSRWHNRSWLRLAGSPLRRLALWIHDRSGGGERTSSNDWWTATSGTPVALTDKPTNSASP